ncbi:MAG: extracellular solute-binding protein [Lachnospiraceae bacterium]|nr:extracellular solute-binding protein [Lachnospiraceae bacterium]
MKKRFSVSRVLSAILAGAMILGTMVGCGTEEASGSDGSAVENSAGVEAVEVTYPLDTDETLSIALLNDAAVSAVSKSIVETPFAKAWQEQTGVEIEFTVCENANALQLLFADGDLPDIVIWTPYSYAGGPAKAIEDGIMEPLTWEEIETYAPDYAKILTEGHPDIARTYKTDNGDYIGFGQIPCSNYYRNASGMTVRADWLKEWGMEVPDTLEELEAYMEKSLEKDTMIAPFESSHIIAPAEYGYWTSPFGLVNADLYQIDGVVHAGYAEPGYKDFLVWLRSLAERGLMDTTFTYLENAVYGGQSAVWHAALGGDIGTYMAFAEDPANGLGDFDVVGMPPLTNEEGIALGGGTTMISGPAGTRVAWITPQCDNKELAMQFLNYGYSEAGNLLFNFGVEGESYTMVDGVPTYTEWITHNPDGLSMQRAMAQYSRAAVGGGPFVQSDDYARQYFWRPQQIASQEQWNKTESHLYNMPIFTVAPEDASEYATLGADIDTFVAEARVKFVDGTWTIDDYEEKYLEPLKEMGLDRYIEIIQEACDRFYAR